MDKEENYEEKVGLAIVDGRAVPTFILRYGSIFVTVAAPVDADSRDVLVLLSMAIHRVAEGSGLSTIEVFERGLAGARTTAGLDLGLATAKGGDA